MAIHNRTYHREFLCAVCKTKFKPHALYIQYAAEHALKELKCALCLSRFENLNDLTVHESLHAVTPHVCQDIECDKEFITQIEFSLHMDEKHSSPSTSGHFGEKLDIAFFISVIILCY